MKLKFDSNLDYQTEAVKAVTDLFKGQTLVDAFFTVNGQTDFDYMRYDEKSKSYYKDEQRFGQGVGNRLTISDYDILENLRKIQEYNGLTLSESLDSRDFNIEMETGTGKTYVYLKTIFELNKKYGFTKFIIVVPSIAIKEGVYKTIEITKEHFKELYDNIPYDSFVYDSSKLEQVRNFATSSNIQIMIINIDAFNKSFTKGSFNSTKKQNNSNIIHREQDKLSGYKPIELIAETNPVVIIDEPQSVMGGKGEEAVSYLNPLCTLRYSATHKEIQNLIYKLNAIKAYEMNLVKGIEVANVKSGNDHNKAYLKLIETNNKKSPITAKIEVDINDKGTIKRKVVTVKQGTDLSEAKITNSDIYTGYTVDEIYCGEGNEYISFTQKEDILEIGVPVGEIDDITIKRAQIRKTIEEHLNKELKLNSKGIKVLSLFFIDKVANYRTYDEEGNPQKGKYAEIFEKEYKDILTNNDKYIPLLVNNIANPEKAHNGYFSIDSKGKNKGKFKDSKTGKSTDDENTFNLIMRDKEELLSLDNPMIYFFTLRFKRSWDNPNVFQICTLNETSSTMKKRQEIGRGLRLCVNQKGERIYDKSINTLTVMANESYETFASSLQSEIEADTGIKFGIIEETSFAHITMKNSKDEFKPIGTQDSRTIFNHFKEINYINDKGKVQDALKVAIRENNVVVPKRFESIKKDIIEVIEEHIKKVEVKNADQKIEVKVNKHVYLDPEFKDFWDKIKHKTTYSVNFNSDELIEKCSKALEKVNVTVPKLIYTKSNLTIDAVGVSIDEEGKIPPSIVYTHEEEEVQLPDIITILQKETDLTRKTIVQILIKSNTLNQFKKNPQEYIENAIKIIKREMSHMLIDGIKYNQLDDYYDQSLFCKEELYGYLEKNIIESEHSVYDYIIYDSEIEKQFAQKLERYKDKVKLYTKLPRWFKIKTPIGNYTPDWAVLLDDDRQNKMYFIVETKGTTDPYDLRENEKVKIECGKKHFKTIAKEVQFEITNDCDAFISKSS